MMHEKTRSLFVLTTIYGLVLSAGYLSLSVFSSMPWMLAYLMASLVMASCVFLFSLFFRNASVYDPYWSVIPPFLLLSRVLLIDEPIETGTLFMLVALFFWGGRLTYNWGKNWHGFTHQDWRYTMLMERRPKSGILINYFGIHLFPTLVVYLQLIGAIKVIGANPRLNIGLFMSGIVIMAATILQFIADHQMYRYRHEKSDRSVFEQGLWRVSRHPNYFGEIMVWWGVYLIYVSVFRVLDVHMFAPVAMTGLFVFISIPMLEKKMVSKHPDYNDYQLRVSMLIPIPRVRNSRSEWSDEHAGG